MSLFVPGKRVRHRKFSYEPRFYDPRRDEKIKQRIRIQGKARRRSPIGIVYFALLLALAVYIYMSMN